ncbi:MAG: hypothetical protein HQL49_13445, partial [Gammaproteobacteria bacterium]|nr:hypothetical protein [Gammaproteobacteria bacterium]
MINRTFNRLLAPVAGLSMLLPISGTSAADLPDFSELAAAVSPAVVNISTTQKVEPKGHFKHPFSMPDIPGGSDIEDLFRRFFKNPEGQNQLPPQEGHSLGSG